MDQNESEAHGWEDQNESQIRKPMDESESKISMDQIRVGAQLTSPNTCTLSIL